MPSGNKKDNPELPDALLLPKRRDLLKVLGVGGATALAGCMGSGGGGGGSTETTQGGTDTKAPTPSGKQEVQGKYVYGDGTGAETLHWLQISDVPSDMRVNLTLDSAYAITPEKEVFPLWADISTDDSRVYTVKLRDNLQWSDPYGQMTAEDWVYMINKVFEAKNNWAGYTNQTDWIRNDKFIPVEKTGKLSFEIQLPEVDPAFPLRPIMWGQYCLPKGLLKKYVPKQDGKGLKKDKEIQTLAYAGNLGAYDFKKWDREAQFVATRADDYYMREASDVPEVWKGAPYFKNYTYKVIPEESTRLTALKEGELTRSNIPETKAKQFEKRDDINVNIAPQSFLTLLIYNMRANGFKPFRKQSVRRALSYAINKKVVTKNILRGYATPAHTFQPQFSDWYNDSQVLETGIGDRFSTKKARTKLKKALSDTKYGYEGETLVGPDGDPVSLKLVYATGTKTTQTACEYFAEQYGKIGIDVSLKGVKFNTMLSKYAQNSYQGKGKPKWNAGSFNTGPRNKALSKQSWDMMYGIIFNTYPRTPASTRSFFTKQSSTNFYGYYPKTDFASLYSKASTTADKKKRNELFGKIFGKLSKEQPQNFIAMSVDIEGYDDALVGPVEQFGTDWNTQAWYFDKQ
jgi:peptide/nickel transport system substrate-binding protein